MSKIPITQLTQEQLDAAAKLPTKVKTRQLVYTSWGKASMPTGSRAKVLPTGERILWKHYSAEELETLAMVNDLPLEVLKKTLYE